VKADQKPAAEEERPPRDRTLADELWLAVRGLFSVVGGASAVVGVVVAVGIIAHAAHLRMLGLPFFALPRATYPMIALDFVVSTLVQAVAAAGLVGATLFILCGAVLVAALTWLDSREPARRTSWADWWIRWRAGAYAGMTLLMLFLGALLAARAGTALGGRSVGLLWSIHEAPTTSATSISRLSWRRLALAEYTDADIRLWLLTRWKSDEARANLERHYGVLALGTIVLLLWTILARRWRASMRPETPSSRPAAGSPSALMAADVAFEVPAGILLLLLLLLLPANYGAVMREPVYPKAMFCREADRGPSCPIQKNGIRSVTAYVLSPAESDADTVTVLFEEYDRWVLQSRKLTAPWEFRLLRQSKDLFAGRRGD
jgi:hypothetical protein